MSKLTLGSLFSGSGGFELGGILAGITPVWSSEIEPFAIRVTTKQMPFLRHYGDISTIDGSRIEPVDIITFGSPCFPMGTLVLTDKGYIEIEKIKVGMRVLTHKGRWKSVTAIGSKSAKTIILKGNHYGLECTPNHPIYCADIKTVYTKTCNGKSKADRSLSEKRNWVAAEKMQNRLWAVPRKIEYLPIESPHYSGNKQQKLMPEMNEDFFYFVGRWLGDGWVRDEQRIGRPKGQQNGQIIICDSLDKENELKIIVKTITDRYHTEKIGNTIKFKFCSQVLCIWLTENFGKYASGKYIPSWVYGLGEKYRSSLLKGIIDSDGHQIKSQNNMWRITTASKKLAEGLRLLCELQGYSVAVFRTIPSNKTIIEGREVNQLPSYILQFCGNKNRKCIHWQDDEHSWYRVKSFKSTNTIKTVYNITVEDDNSYIADGIVVHNCQDLSVAGKRNGLEGSKSSLFYEAVRIIKEMREKTNGKYPRYIVWENVPGAFSSNNGKDFKAVLDALINIKEENAEVPMPEKGVWPYADCFMGDGWSVAYRLLDAQYWGVPQRRRRIYLVADFAGKCAGEILFKSEGVSGYSQESFRAWQRTANSTRESAFKTELSNVTETDTDSSDMTVYENHSQDTRYKELEKVAPTVSATYGEGGNNQPFIVSKLWNGEDIVPTLTANNAGGNQRMPDKANFNCVVEPFGISADGSNAMKSSNPKSGIYKAKTSRTVDTSGVNPACNQGGIAVVNAERCSDSPAICVQGSMIGRKDKNGPNGNGLNEEKAFTLNTTDKHAVFAMTTGYFQQVEENKTPTILARDYKEPGAVIYAIDRETYNAGKNFDRSLGINTEGINSTLKASGPSAVAYSFDQGASRDVGELFIKEKSKTLTNGSCPGHHNGVIDNCYTVRRLTPTECARLQGFPDRWCKDLETEKPTDEEVYFWHKVFETQRKITGTGKKKTDKQIRSWLKKPHSDSAEYKLWGNGVALPCVFFVLAGIVWANDNFS